MKKLIRAFIKGLIYPASLIVFFVILGVLFALCYCLHSLHVLILPVLGFVVICTLMGLEEKRELTKIDNGEQNEDEQNVTDNDPYDFDVLNLR